MKNKLIVFVSVLSIIFIIPNKNSFAQEKSIAIEWNNILSVSKTTPTLQVVVNPLLQRDSPIHDSIYNSIKNMGADYVRFVPWFPYPHMAVAELRPPTSDSTFWDFSYIDPIVEDFMKSTESHSVILNFSTIPAWMFKNVKDSSYKAKTSDVIWDYNQGTQLRDSSLKELTGYFVRLFSWYTKGGFTDELGKFHKSGHYYKIPYWEILNEPDLEHNITPQLYTKIYDAVSSELKKISPDTKFVGLALAFENNPEWFEYFLNPKNHQKGVSVDGISYHFYGGSDDDSQAMESYQYSFFNKADAFLDRVNYIENIRKRLSPQTFTTVDELGTIWGSQDGKELLNAYWNLSGAMYAYTYLSLMKMGIDVVGESQLVGYPTQYPSVSMINWTNGKPNARYWILYLLKNNFAPGDKLVKTTHYPGNVSAQAFITESGKKLLLINKRMNTTTINLPQEFDDASVEIVDGSTGDNPPVYSHVEKNQLTLTPFSVAVVALKNNP